MTNLLVGLLNAALALHIGYAHRKYRGNDSYMYYSGKVLAWGNGALAILNLIAGFR